MPRPCNDCHESPVAVGLGPGSLHLKFKDKGLQWEFSPSMSPQSALMQFVSIDGRPLVHFSRQGMLRTFNKGEISKILTVGLCMKCHLHLKNSEKGQIMGGLIKGIKCRVLQRLTQ